LFEPDVVCYHCDMPGHRRPSCPHKD
jgi:hypothetical protein